MFRNNIIEKINTFCFQQCSRYPENPCDTKYLKELDEIYFKNTIKGIAHRVREILRNQRKSKSTNPGRQARAEADGFYLSPIQSLATQSLRGQKTGHLRHRIGMEIHSQIKSPKGYMGDLRVNQKKEISATIEDKQKNLSVWDLTLGQKKKKSLPENL